MSLFKHKIMVGSGAVTQANMKISRVNGTAFIDFSDSEAAANKLINHKGYLLKVRDSSKRAIQGYVKAAGTGETLEDKVTGDSSTFTSSVGSWIPESGGTIVASGGKGVITPGGAYAGVRLNGVSVSGQLNKFSFKHRLQSGAQQRSSIRTPPLNAFGFSPTGVETASGDIYRTGDNYTDLRITDAAYNDGGVIEVDDIIFQKVLTPSATGVTITSTKGGSTFNYAALDSAFNYNDSSGYTYELWQVNNAVEVASGSIAAGEMLADTTATNAFVAPVGVDLSAYQTGKYIFAAYNTVGGYAAFGYIKGTAPGGETLDVEILADASFDDDGSWLKLTGWTVSGGNAIANDPAVDYRIWQVFTKTDGQLYKGSAVISALTAGAIRLNIGNVTVGNFTSAATITGYATVTGVGNAIYGLAANTANNLQATVASLSFKRVTDCAATGALIVSAKDGATRAFAYKHASFNPNIASTWKCFYVGD